MKTPKYLIKNTETITFKDIDRIDNLTISLLFLVQKTIKQNHIYITQKSTRFKIAIEAQTVRNHIIMIWNPMLTKFGYIFKAKNKRKTKKIIINLLNVEIMFFNLTLLSRLICNFCWTTEKNICDDIKKLYGYISIL